MNTWKRSVMALTVSALLGAGALGCNTIKGMGRDIEKGGEAIQRGSTAVHDSMKQRSVKAEQEPAPIKMGAAAGP